MNLIKHILKKDILRLRVFLSFWLFILLLSAIVNGANTLVPAGDFSLQYAVEIVLMLIGIIQVVLMVIAVPLLMHSEPLIGTTAFWQTRPIRRGDVLKSKLLFAGVFFVLLPLLVELLVFSVSQVSTTYVLATIPETILSSVHMFLLFMAVAVLTRNFGYYALVMVSYYIFAALLVAGVQISKLFSLLGYTVPPISSGLADSRTLLCSLVGIAFASGIVALQFRTRKTFKSYVLLVVMAAASFWAGQFSPWNLFPEPDTTPDFEAGAVSLSLDPSQRIYTSDKVQLKKGTPVEKNLRGTLLFDGLPKDCYAAVEKVNGTYFVDGKKAAESEIWKRNSFGTMYKPMVSALEEAVAPLGLVKGRHLFSSSTDLLKLSEEDYLKYGGSAGQYLADIALNLFKFEPVAGLPLTVGAQHKDGASAFTVESILKGTEGCTVVLREERINPMFKRDRTPVNGERYVFVLANRETGEAFLQSRKQSISSRFDFSKAQNFFVKRRPLRFTSAEKSLFANPITEEWLVDAELLILKRVWLGKSILPLEADPFAFGRGSVTSYSISRGKGAGEILGKLSEVKLPENATPKEVREYILKIHELSSGQRRWSSNDPQVGMLAAVGPENLEVLIQTAQQGRYYTPYAVKAIAGPEHKELILKNLAAMTTLVDVVAKYGWEDDARETLLAELKYRERLPSAWIRTVAGFEDPETYPDLLAYFENSSGPGSVYESIKNLDGIDLEEAVPKAWKKAKYSEYSYRGWQMTPIAMEYGVLDALDAAGLLLLGNDEYSDHYKQKARTAVRRHVGEFGTDEDFVAWVEANKGSITFDAETKTFKGATPPEAPPNPDARDRYTFSSTQRKKAGENLEALSKVKLSEKATRDDVEKYIKKIHEISSNQSSRSSKDPQVDMLAAVGSGNVDLLLEKVPQSGSYYTLAAVKKLARPEHKQLILTHLSAIPGLVSLVVKYDWVEDAKETLFKELKYQNYLPSEWITAAAQFEDSDTYPDLLFYFVRSSMRSSTYKTIKNLPGIQLDIAIAQAWNSAKYGGSSYQYWDMIPIALEYGFVDALDFIPGLLKDASSNSYYKQNAWSAVHRHVGQFDTEKEFIEWLSVNKGAIQFDPETKIFTGAQPPEKPPNPDAKSVSLPSGDNKVDVEGLKRDLSFLAIPENPSENQVKEYIDRVRNTGKSQGHFVLRSIKDDPRTEKLVALGPEQVPVLIQMIESNQEYAVDALKQLIQPEHKDVVLLHLVRLPDLIGVVVTNGWEADAKETLIGQLKYKEKLPQEWLHVVAGFEEPETYPALIDFFIRGNSRVETYSAIKDLPSIDLESAVAQAWESAKKSGRHQSGQMLPIVLECGILDGLDVYVKIIGEEGFCDCSKDGAKAAVEKYTGQTGTDAELAQWIQTHRDNLRFDPEQKKFSVSDI